MKMSFLVLMLGFKYLLQPIMKIIYYKKFKINQAVTLVHNNLNN